MKIAIRMSNLRMAMLPIAMIGGALLYPWMGYIVFLSPYLIFIMLFITYCKLRISDIRPHLFDIYLLVTQMILAAIAYFSTIYWNSTVAEGFFICFFIPTATAAPVITSMLGGSISRVASYSLVCNAFISVAGPLVLAAISDNGEMTFSHSFLLILSRVFPLILLPLALALGLRYFFPKIHEKVVGMQSLSFYLWAISLFIVVGSCVSFAIQSWNPQTTSTMIWLCIAGLAACLLQFYIGRKIGARFNDKISGGQSLGQKNTVLAIWLALAYLNPLSSIAPASYVAWQNIVNSIQLMKRKNITEISKNN